MNIIKLKQDINHKSEERKGIIAVVYGQPEAKAKKAVAGGKLKPHRESGQPQVIGKMAVAGGQAKAKTKRTVVSGGFCWETEAAVKKTVISPSCW